jgi:hypothetical protein
MVFCVFCVLVFPLPLPNCSVPSPRASLERKISFADLKGRELEEVNFCDNLHYSKQARRRFWFFTG